MYGLFQKYFKILNKIVKSSNNKTNCKKYGNGEIILTLIIANI